MKHIPQHDSNEIWGCRGISSTYVATFHPQHDGHEGFLDRNITHTPTLYIDPTHPHFTLIFLVEF